VVDADTEFVVAEATHNEHQIAITSAFPETLSALTLRLIYLHLLTNTSLALGRT
jgi:hypothetical protein